MNFKSSFLLLYIFILSLLLAEYILLIKEVNIFLLIALLVALALLFSYIFNQITTKHLLKKINQMERIVQDTIHELIVPASTVITNVDLIAKSEQSQRNHTRLQRIKHSAKHLLALYDDLEFYIKRELERQDKEECNLKELIESRLAFFKNYQNGIEFVVDLEEVHAKCNIIGFSKVIDNLLSNAIKYNKPNGLVRIRLRASLLMVEDSGVGMDDATIVKIFEQYYQEDSKNYGKGYGMYFIKSFCDEEGITINIDSTKGVGTKIYLKGF